MVMLAGVRLRLLAFQLSLLILPVCTVFSGIISAQSSSDAATVKGPDLSNPAYSAASEYWGQCTWYARGRAKENDNANLTAKGNAGSWPITDRIPRAHSIAVWEGPAKTSFGHVAYVEKVVPIPADNPQKYDIYITEANFSNCSKNTCSPQKDIVGGDFGGGFDGCRILTISKADLDNHSSKRGSYTLKGFYHLPISPAFAPTSGREMTCTPHKVLRINTFSHQQNGNLVTLTFTGEGITAGAKVLAAGPNWRSDEALVDPLVVTDNGEIQLAATISVQDAASFNVAIQNPDMEVSAAQQISVTAAPPAQVSNVQPVPAEEPVSTPAAAPDVPSAPAPLVIPSAQPTPETAAATAPQATPDAATTVTDSAAQQAAAPQPADQEAQASAPAQSVAPAQTPEQPAPEATQPAPQDSTAATQTSFPPVLLRISPGTHAPGQFTVDLYGLNFQQGAKIIAQGINWDSDQAAVTFLGPNHIQATIVAFDPAQFTIAVQNPDAQTSAARRFVVVQPPPAAAESGPASATAPVANTNAPIIPAPDAAQDASATGSALLASTSAPISAPPPATAAVVTAPASAVPATASSATTAQAVVPISAPPAASSTSAATPATLATRNSVSAPAANKVPISAPLVPRGAMNNAGSTISVAPPPRSGALAATNPIVRTSPVRVVAASSMNGATQPGLSFCGRSIAPLPLQDIPSGKDCGKYLEGQCVAYARCRSEYKGSVPGGDARNWPANQPDKQKVQPGDVVIFTNGEFGHVAYVESVSRDISTRVTGVTVSEANYGRRLEGFPNLSACGVTKKYGIVDTRTVGINDFQGVYHPDNAPGQFLPPLNPGSPVLHVSASSSLKSGDSVDIVGENFSRNSRVSLLLTVPGAAETFLVSFTSDANGGFHYPFSAACDAKAGAYSIRALDQAPAGSGITGRKSIPVALTVAGKATHCILGIPAAQASSKSVPNTGSVSTTNVPPRGPGSAPVPASAKAAPVLSQVTPNSHAAGRFSIDLYGSGFQPGAKLIAQGAGWSSDQAAVMYLGPDHLRAVIDGANPAQFTVAVRNPDSQISAAYPFQVTPATMGVTTKSAQVPAVGNASRSPVPAPSTPAPVSAPQNAGSTVSSAHSTTIPITAPPLNTRTPAKQPVIVNSTPVLPKPAAPAVFAPQIKPTPIPVRTIKPMPTPQPNVAYPPNTTTAKPVLHPPSPATTVSMPPQMPVSTVPTAPGIKPASSPAPWVNTVHPKPQPIAPPHPAPAPVVKAQPQPFTPPVRVAPTPVPHTYSPPPPAPRTIPQPTPAPRAYTPPPPPPRAVPQPTPVPQPAKTPTPKKP